MPPRPSKSKAATAPYPPGWEPFLGTIRENLDDDTPRLVFADWLQENGDEDHAEFIRLQCAQARGGVADGTCVNELLRANRKRWLRGLPKSLIDNPSRCQFRRGLPALVTMKANRFVADGNRVQQLTALEELTLEEPSPAAINSPALVGVPGLKLMHVTSAIVEALAASRAVASLRGISLTPRWGVRVSQRSLRALFANPKLKRLRRLETHTIEHGDIVAQAIVGARHITGLEQLTLWDATFCENGMAALANCPRMASLRVLRLPGNMVTDDGLWHLVNSPYVRNLVELDLSYNELTRDSVLLLAEWEGLRSIRVLDLQNNRLRAADKATILKSSHAKNLVDVRI